jgi:hypothetical protein
VEEGSIPMAVVVSKSFNVVCSACLSTAMVAVLLSTNGPVKYYGSKNIPIDQRGQQQQ